jgi:hypothetical protein
MRGKDIFWARVPRMKTRKQNPRQQVSGNIMFVSYSWRNPIVPYSILIILEHLLPDSLCCELTSNLIPKFAIKRTLLAVRALIWYLLDGDSVEFSCVVRSHKHLSCPIYGCGEPTAGPLLSQITLLDFYLEWHNKSAVCATSIDKFEALGHRTVEIYQLSQNLSTSEAKVRRVELRWGHC